jgi:hypothetical protein
MADLFPADDVFPANDTFPADSPSAPTSAPTPDFSGPVRSFTLRGSFSGFKGGQMFYSGYTFDVGAALTAGGGVITTSSALLANALANYPALQ